MPEIELLLPPVFGQKEPLLIILNQADQLCIIDKNDLPLTPVNYIITSLSI